MLVCNVQVPNSDLGQQASLNILVGNREVLCWPGPWRAEKMKVQRIWMVENARPRYLGGPAWTQPKFCRAGPSRVGCFWLKASSVQSDCAQLTPPPAMQSPGEAVPELTQRLDCCQLHLAPHGWPWSSFPCTPDSWIHVEGVSAFPLCEHSGVAGPGWQWWLTPGIMWHSQLDGEHQ